MLRNEKGRRRANGLALTHIPMPLASDDLRTTAATSLRQEAIDVVAILASRTRVALPTARLHAELFGFGGVAHG